MNDRRLPDEWLFCLWVGLVPMMRVRPLGRLTVDVIVADLLFPLVALIWFFMVVTRRRAWSWNRFHTLCGIYLALVGISAIFSSQPARSAVQWMATAYLVAIAVIAASLAGRTDGLRRIAVTLLIVNAVVSASAILSLIAYYAGAGSVADLLGVHHFGSLPPGPYPRIRSTFFNFNMYCSWAVMAFVLTVAAARMRWISARTAWISGLATVAGAFFSLSPGFGGMFLAAGVILFVVLRERDREHSARVSLVAGIIGAILFFAATLVEPGALMRGELAPGPRPVIWRQVLEQIAREPLLGVGAGVDVTMHRYITPEGLEQRLTDAHNTLLAITAQNGIFTTIAFAALMIWLLQRVPWTIAGDEQAALHTFLAIALVSAFLYGTLSGSFEDTRHVWLLFGLLASLRVSA